MTYIQLFNEKKCYYCGRGNEIEKDLMNSLGKITTVSESQRIHEFELKEYRISFRDFIPRKAHTSDIEDIEGLNLDQMCPDGISIWVCPICLCLIRDATYASGSVT